MEGKLYYYFFRDGFIAMVRFYTGNYESFVAYVGSCNRTNSKLFDLSKLFRSNINNGKELY